MTYRDAKHLKRLVTLSKKIVQNYSCRKLKIEIKKSSHLTNEMVGSLRIKTGVAFKKVADLTFLSKNLAIFEVWKQIPLTRYGWSGSQTRLPYIPQGVYRLFDIPLYYNCFLQVLLKIFPKKSMYTSRPFLYMHSTIISCWSFY